MSSMRVLLPSVGLAIVLTCSTETAGVLSVGWTAQNGAVFTNNIEGLGTASISRSSSVATAETNFDAAFAASEPASDAGASVIYSDISNMFYMGIASPADVLAVAAGNASLRNVGIRMVARSISPTSWSLLIYENEAGVFGRSYSFQAGASLAFSVYIRNNGQVRFILNGNTVYDSSTVISGMQHLVLAFAAPGSGVSDFAWISDDNWCTLESVQCPAIPCFTGGCIEGQCNYSPSSGDSCDDGDPDTIDDTCSVGICSGIDPCHGITCSSSDCHPNPVCQLGTCFPGTQAIDGTSCALPGDIAGECMSGVCLAITTTSPQTESTTNTIANTETPDLGSICVNPLIDCPATPECIEPYRCIGGGCFGGVNVVADGTPCNDGNSSTVNETCVAGSCIGVSRCEGVICESQGQCVGTTGCNTTTGTCDYFNLARGTFCDDGNPSTLGDECSLGLCVGNDPCTGFDCSIARQEQCRSIGTCYAISKFVADCTNPIAPEGSACTDFDGTTENDICDDSGVCSGTPKCQGVVCTAPSQCYNPGTCVPTTGQCSSPVPKSAQVSCDDGDDLTIDDVCDGSGGCSGTTLCENITCADPPPCRAAVTCQLGVCPPFTTWLDDFDVCDDGNPETVDDFCLDGICLGRSLCAGVECPLAIDQCLEPIGICSFGECQYTARAAGWSCDDGDNNTSFDICNGNATVPVCEGVDLCDIRNVTCEDPPPCHEPVDCILGSCSDVYPPLSDFLPDGSPRFCQVENRSHYGDEVPENASLVCRAGVCVPEFDCTGVVCPSPGGCELAPECLVGHPVETRCSGPTMPAPEFTPCDDNNNRTLSDQCQLVDDNSSITECHGTDPCTDVVCPPVDQCHIPVECSWPNGTCPDPEVNVGANCDDGFINTINDTCTDTGACIGVDLCIENSVNCEERSCHTSRGCFFGDCLYDRHPDGDECDDLDLSTNNDTCHSGLCFGIPNQLLCHNPVVCTDTGCIQEPVTDGTNCDDGNPLTHGDFCFSGQCIGPLPCPADDRCVAWADRVGVQESSSYGLQRVSTGAGWSAGATSIESISWGQDSLASTRIGIEFRPAQTDKTFVVGLANSSDTRLFTDAAWSVLLNYHGQINVLAYGALFANLGSYEVGDVISIRIGSGNRLEVLQNDNVVFGTPWVERADPYYVVINLYDFEAEADLFQWVTAATACGAVNCTRPSSTCATAETCELGTCIRTSLNEGSNCSDGNDATSGDICIGGNCIGVDLCTNVTCPLPTACQASVYCMHGVCVVEGNEQLVGIACDDGNINTENDTCTLDGDCVGIDECLINLPCTAPNSTLCQDSVSCFRGNCFYGLIDEGGGCDDGDPSTTNDVCAGAPLSCSGSKLSCSPNSDDSISFSCDLNGSSLLNSSTPFTWRFQPDDVITNGCICTTTWSGFRFQASLPDLSIANLTDSQCARLLCTGENFRFSQCSNDGQVVAAADWTTEGVLEASAVYEPNICTESGAAVPINPIPSTTPTPSTCAPADCHIVLDPRSTIGQECSISTNQEVSWEWDGAGLNIWSPNFPGSGNPALSGCFRHRFDLPGVFSYRATQFANVFGNIRVTQSAYVNNSQSADLIVTWEPQHYAANRNIEICIGSAIRFQWSAQSENISLQSGEPGLDSAGQLFTAPADTGGAITVVFSAPGTYPYYDGEHPWLTSQVSVVACSNNLTNSTATVPDSCNQLVTLLTSPVALTGVDAVYVQSPSITSTFTIQLTFTATRGGYLFAKSTYSGSRYYSVYLSRTSPTVHFYYRIVGSSTQRRVSFYHGLTNGVEYSLQLTVNGTEVTLSVSSPLFDFGSTTKRLEGIIDDCGPVGTDCVFGIGARSALNNLTSPAPPPPPFGLLLSGSGQGVSAYTAWGLTGSIFSAVIYPDCAFLPDTISATTPPPTNASRTYFNFLENRASASNFEDFLQPNGNLRFNGTSGLRLTSYPPVVEEEWSIAMTVIQSNNTFGYLFAKTDGSGAKRYYAVYSRAQSQQLVFYYTAVVQGSEQAARKTFENINIADGDAHEILFSVVQGLVVVRIDGTNFLPSDRSPLLSTQLADCGPPSDDCIFRLGDRSRLLNDRDNTLGSAYAFDGMMQYATFRHGSPTLDAFPTAGATNVQHLTRQASVRGEIIQPIQSFQPLSRSFSVYFSVSIQNRTSGYLLAKSNMDGSVRYFSVYMMSRNTGDFVRVYYTPQNANAHTSVTFAGVSFADGESHKVMLSVSNTIIKLKIDQQTVIQSLEGPIQDCGFPQSDCVMNMGVRASAPGRTGYPLTGAIYEGSIIYGNSLSSFPSH